MKHLIHNQFREVHNSRDVGKCQKTGSFEAPSVTENRILTTVEGDENNSFWDSLPNDLNILTQLLPWSAAQGRSFIKISKSLLETSCQLNKWGYTFNKLLSLPIAHDVSRTKLITANNAITAVLTSTSYVIIIGPNIWFSDTPLQCWWQYSLPIQ